MKSKKLHNGLQCNTAYIFHIAYKDRLKVNVIEHYITILYWNIARSFS